MRRVSNHCSFRRLFGISLIGLLSASLCCGQELKVRKQKAPYYVGDAIAIEVDAIDFDVDPKIEIENTDQPHVNLAFKNSSRSQSIETYQIGNQLVRNTITKTTFQYQVEFTKAGTYEIGPFVTERNGQKMTRPAITFKVAEIEVDEDMIVEIKIPPGDKYPGQRVPVQLIWKYAGSLDSIANITIRSPLFDQFRFLDAPVRSRQNAIPIATRNGIERFPAKFSAETIDGKRFVVGTVHRTMVPETPAKVVLPETFVSYRKVIGYQRSNDIFSFFDEQAVTVPKKGIGFPVSFEVKPFPSQGKPENFAGAVGSDFHISTSLNRTSLHSGDPLTLQINVSGTGNIESIGLPKFGTAFSPEKFDWPDNEAAGVVDGNQKQFKVSFRIKDESVSEIPALSFSWFDPERKEYRTASSDPIPVEVKPGKLVSSTDVIRNSAELRDPMQLEEVAADWSIETDPGKLVRRKNQTSNFSWISYLVGIAFVAFVLLDLNRRKPGSPAAERKKSIREICGRIRTVTPSPEMVSELSSSLRKLLALLEEPDRNQKEAVELTVQIDELISRCDSVAFRPTTPTADEQAKLIQTAQEVIREL